MDQVSELLPIVDLRQPSDRFRCEPYAADISARTCLARQDRAKAADSYGERMETEKCRKCPDAPLIAERVSLSAVDAAISAASADRRNAHHRSHVKGGKTHSKPRPAITARPETTMATTETMCREAGCKNPAGRDGKRADLAGLCNLHKQRVHAREYVAKKRGDRPAKVKAAKAPPKPVAKPKPAKPTKTAAKPLKVQPARVSNDLDDVTMADALDAVRVVRQLGGLARAEAIADAMAAV